MIPFFHIPPCVGHSACPFDRCKTLNDAACMCAVCCIPVSPDCLSSAKLHSDGGITSRNTKECELMEGNSNLGKQRKCKHHGTCCMLVQAGKQDNSCYCANNVIRVMEDQRDLIVLSRDDCSELCRTVPLVLLRFRWETKFKEFFFHFPSSPTRVKRSHRSLNILELEKPQRCMASKVLVYLSYTRLLKTLTMHALLLPPFQKSDCCTPPTLCSLFYSMFQIYEIIMTPLQLSVINFSDCTS